MSGKYIVHKAIELDALSAKTRKQVDQVDHWLLSPKYDGCHVVFLFDGDQFVKAFSRTAELVVSMDHIARSLLDHYADAYKGLGKWAIAGEAWTPGVEFNDISGWFRRQYANPQLGFVPFDTFGWYPSVDTFDPIPVTFHDTRGYRQRLDSLIGDRRDALSLVSVPRYIHLPYPLAECLPFAEAEARRLKAQGFYDGAILAQANGKYTQGAGKGGEFIKVKPLLSYTVQVHGAELAKGEKTGKNTAALKFYLDGLEQKVSTGLTQEQVDGITREFEQGRGPWLNSYIEVEAMGKTVNGYLREPRFKGIRTDA